MTEPLEDLGARTRRYYADRAPTVEWLMERGRVRARRMRWAIRGTGAVFVVVLVAVTAALLRVPGSPTEVETSETRAPSDGSGQWHELPDLPQPLQAPPAAAMIGDHVVVLGMPVDGGRPVAYALALNGAAWADLPAVPFAELPSGYGDGSGSTILARIDSQRAAVLGRHQDGQPLAVSILHFDGGQWSWSPATTAPTTASADVALAATSTHVVLWGGADDERNAVADGAVLDLATGAWRTTGESPLGARSAVRTAPVGNQILIVGGADAARSHADGALYDPRSDSWQPIPAPEGFAMVEGLVSSTGGTYALGHSSVDPSIRRAVVAEFVGPGDMWERLPEPPITTFRFNAAVTQDHLVIWSGERYAATGPAASASTLRDGAVLDIAHRTWRQSTPMISGTEACLMAVAVHDEVIHAIGGVQDCGAGNPRPTTVAVRWTP
jgi:hypothetical protein